MKPTKQERAETLKTCLLIACNHFKADPRMVYSSGPLRTTEGVMARAAVWLHMSQCGMTPEEIGKIFHGKTANIVKGHRGLGLRFRMTVLDREMIATMPKLNVIEEVES